MDSLAKFSAEVMRTAERNKKAELEKVRTEEEKRLERARFDIEKETTSKISIESKKIKAKSEQEIEKYRSDLKKKILLRRNEMFDEIFAKVLENIREYKKSDSYKAKLIENIKKAVAKMGDGAVVCYVMPEDMEFISKEMPNLILKEPKEAIIGGFYLENREKHLFLDMTIDSRIEEQKKDFYAKSGLVME